MASSIDRLKFLQDVELSQGFRNKWKPKMSGWVALHAHIRNYMAEHPQADVSTFYAKLMLLELSRVKPRLSMLARLKGSFDMRRRTEEASALAKVATL